MVNNHDFIKKTLLSAKESSLGFIPRLDFFMCAQHGRKLVGESPIRGLIVPTVSLRQGCPPRGGI